jgi:membrane protease YdiL (CAAX protease family)
MTPWLLSESERLTARLGTGQGKGQKLDLGPFWVFLPVLGATALVGWVAMSAAPNLQYEISLLSEVLMIGGGCLALQHEYRVSSRQLGIHRGVFSSPPARRWTLIAVVTSGTFRALPLLVAHFRDPSLPPHLAPNVQQAWAHLPSFIVFAIILAPIVEEFGFRGYLYLALRQNWGKTIAALVASAVFAVMHGKQLLVYFCLSMFYILFNDRAESLWPSILAHIIWNAGLLTLPLVATGA